jgi:hypothetical protein
MEDCLLERIGIEQAEGDLNRILRWVAAGLLESVRRMKKIRNYKSLVLLRENIMKELKIKIAKSYKIAV